METKQIKGRRSDSVPELDARTAASLLEAWDGAAVLIDADRILATNRAAEQLAGKGEAPWVGRSLAEWTAWVTANFHPIDGADGQVEATPRRSLRLHPASGPRRIYAYEGHPVTGAAGVERGLLLSLRDVTEATRDEDAQARREEQLRRELRVCEARLEQVEHYKMELTANVTHDLRTPLASIKASVSGLLAGDVQYDPQELRETLSVIEEETERLQRRVTNLLSMARMESGGGLASADWLDITDVIATALEGLRGVKGERKLKLDFPDDIPLVKGDYDQLVIAIRNLVENAFLYSPPESPIEISVSMSLGQLRIRVRDYGSGLMPDEFEQIFNKFYRGRSARRIPGTGLGLPICRGIAEAHGGRLWAEHAPGGGVAFVLSLPLTEGEPELVTP